MDKNFFEQRGVNIMVMNISLGTQLDWFKQLLPSLCKTVSGNINCFLKHVHKCKCMYIISTLNSLMRLNDHNIHY